MIFFFVHGRTVLGSHVNEPSNGNYNSNNNDDNNNNNNNNNNSNNNKCNNNEGLFQTKERQISLMCKQESRNTHYFCF